MIGADDVPAQESPQTDLVAPDTHQEHVAWAAVQHGEPGIAVVDARGFFRGLISAQSRLAVLLEEHDEDMARLGGSLGSASGRRRVLRDAGRQVDSDGRVRDGPAAVPDRTFDPA